MADNRPEVSVSCDEPDAPHPGRFTVEVRDAASTTRHVVTIPAGLAGDLGIPPDQGGERLVRTSFEFLLEREPASSILRSFSLDVIARYFPEWPAEMRSRLGSG